MGINMFLKINARGFAAAIVCAVMAGSAVITSVSPASSQGIMDGEMFDPAMIRAIRAGDNDTVRAELFATSPNDRSNQGIPALIVAVESRNLEALHLLADAGARIDNRARRTDRTALTVAAGMGEAAIVRELLARGADVDMTGSGSEVALLKAARNGHAEILEILIEAGADLTETDLAGDSALNIAERNRHRQAAQVLRDAGVY